MTFKGKSVLVTGAGKGIGRTLCTQLLELGAEVIGITRSQSDVDALNVLPKCRAYCVDLSNAEATRAVVTAAMPVDLLVNCAGTTALEPFLEASADRFDEIMAVNCRAAMIVSQVFAQDLIGRGKGGAIVNVSSTASTSAVRDHTAYCASKGALDAMTRVMALELGPHGIRVNCVNPTVTLTPMGEKAWSDPERSAPMLARIPMGRFCDPSDVAATILYLLSDQAAMVNGAMLPVDGGYGVI